MPFLKTTDWKVSREMTIYAKLIASVLGSSLQWCLKIKMPQFSPSGLSMKNFLLLSYFKAIKRNSFHLRIWSYLPSKKKKTSPVEYVVFGVLGLEDS